MEHHAFRSVEDLIKKIRAYPRRVKPDTWDEDLIFEADNGTTFAISQDDLDATPSQYMENDIPRHVELFLRAVRENKLGDWCEGVNYGKPDFYEPVAIVGVGTMEDKHVEEACKRLCEFVEVDPDRASGRPVLRGTRFPVAQLLAELADGGFSLGEIATDYELDYQEAQRFLEALSIYWSAGK